MEWNKKNSIGLIEQLNELAQKLQEILPGIIAEEQARLNALESIMIKHNDNLKKDRNA